MQRAIDKMDYYSCLNSVRTIVPSTVHRVPCTPLSQGQMVMAKCNAKIVEDVNKQIVSC